MNSPGIIAWIVNLARFTSNTSPLSSVRRKEARTARAAAKTCTSFLFTIFSNFFNSVFSGSEANEKGTTVRRLKNLLIVSSPSLF